MFPTIETDKAYFINIISDHSIKLIFLFENLGPGIEMVCLTSNYYILMKIFLMVRERSN